MSAALLLAAIVSSAPAGTAAPGPYELPPGGFSVAWQEAGVSRPWNVGEERQVAVTVTNLSPYAWPDRAAGHPAADGRYAVRLSHCWRAEAGAPTDDCWLARTELLSAVAAGTSGTFILAIKGPTRPGRFQIEFDLVQETVSWFRSRGGQTLVVPTIVRPPASSSPVPRARVVLRVVGALAMTIGLLFFVGFGLTHWLVPPRLSGAATLFMPLVGLAALSALGHALAYAPVGTDLTLVPILLACAALDIAAWRRGVRLRFPRTHLPVWLTVVGALALTSYPLVVLGDLTALGGEIDTVIYVVRADWMRGHGMLVRPDRPPSEDFMAALIWEPIRNGLRQGDQFVLAVVSSLARLRSYRMFSILMSVFQALAPLGIFALARYGFRLPNVAASLAAGLVAVQPLAHYVALNSFMSQNSGLAFFPFVVLSVLVALRPGPWRKFVLAGLLVGALSTFYTVYVVYLVPVMALAALNEWLVVRAHTPRGGVRSLLVVAGRLLAVAVCAVALFPVGWMHGLVGLRTIGVISSGQVGDVAGQGNVALYPHPGEAFGLISHASAAHHLQLPQLPAIALTALLAALLLAVAWGVVVAPRRIRPFLAGLLVVAAAGAAHQRFWLGGGKGYPYGYFKVVSLFAPLVLIVLAHACVWCWRVGPGGAWPWRIPRRVAGAGLAAAVFVLSLFNAWQETPVLAYRYLAVDRATADLDGVGIVLPRSEGLVLADKRWPGRVWAVYMLGHGNVFDRIRPGQPYLPAEARSPRVLRYAFVAGGDGLEWAPGEPWGVPDQREVLWEGRRFMLLRRTDGALADLRLSHPDTRVGLAQPMRIEVGRRLSVSGAGVASGRLSQDLEWCPQWLEVSLTVPRGGVLRIAEGSVTREQELSAGTHAVRLPAAPRLDLDLQPRDEEAQVWGVKALGSLDR